MNCYVNVISSPANNEKFHHIICVQIMIQKLGSVQEHPKRYCVIKVNNKGKLKKKKKTFA